MTKELKKEIEKLLANPDLHIDAKMYFISLFKNCGGDVSTLEVECTNPKQYWNGEKCVDRGGDGEPDGE